MFNYQKELKEVILNEYWTMANGTKIKVKNMKISHLRNCINMCRRKKLKDNVRKLECALAIRENRYNEFLKQDDLSDITTVYVEDELLSMADYKDRMAYAQDIKGDS